MQPSDISLFLHQVTSVGPYQMHCTIPLITAVITVLVTHHQHALKGSNFSHSKNRVSRDWKSSLVTLAYSYIKLQVWVLIEYNTYDYCCNHSAGNKSPACLKRSNYSHSKNRVSSDCQCSPVTLAYSFIKLQVWVLIEYIVQYL